jgi:hypothetical protein
MKNRKHSRSAPSISHRRINPAKPASVAGLRLKELRRMCRVLAAAGRDTAAIDIVIQAGGYPRRSGWEIGGQLRLGKAAFLMYAQTEGRFPSTIRPCDANKLELAEVRRRFHAPRKAKALAAQRAAAKARQAGLAAGAVDAADLDCRASAIHAVLSAADELTVGELMTAVGRTPAFKRNDGRRFLTGRTLRGAIQRTLQVLLRLGMVWIKTEVEKHGWSRQRISLRRGPSRGAAPVPRTAEMPLSLDERSACAAGGDTAAAEGKCLCRSACPVERHELAAVESHCSTAALSLDERSACAARGDTAAPECRSTLLTYRATRMGEAVKGSGRHATEVASPPPDTASRTETDPASSEEGDGATDAEALGSEGVAVRDVERQGAAGDGRDAGGTGPGCWPQGTWEADITRRERKAMWLETGSPWPPRLA